jgi:hypothetical protein
MTLPESQLAALPAQPIAGPAQKRSPAIGNKNRETTPSHLAHDILLLPLPGGGHIEQMIMVFSCCSFRGDSLCHRYFI